MSKRYEVTVSISVADVEDVKEAIECVEESWQPPEYVTADYPSFEKVEKFE